MDNSLAARDMHNRNHSPSLHVSKTLLDEAATDLNLPSNLEGRLVHALQLHFETKELFVDSTQRKQSSHLLARDTFVLPICTTTAWFHQTGIEAIPLRTQWRSRKT